MSDDIRLAPVPRPNNMGLMRYYLAVSVLIAHFNALTDYHIFWPTNSYDAVGAFFALSGYLVYGSFLKHNKTSRYIFDRALRILPPYFLIVLLCSFGLSAFSTLTPAEYFSSGKWYGYLAANLSFLNFLQPNLPGVFTDNPISAVNGSLWTMKVEWLLYLSIPIIVWAYRKWRINAVKFCIFIFLLSAGYRFCFNYLYEHTGAEVYNIFGQQAAGQMTYFLSGVLIRLLYDKIMKHKIIVLSLALVAYVLSFYMFHEALRPVSVSLYAIMLSLIGKWGIWAGDKDNFSYDIYLFHFPVIQLMVQLQVIDSVPPIVGVAICTVITFVLSFLSWNLVGKHFMKMRKRC